MEALSNGRASPDGTGRLGLVRCGLSYSKSKLHSHFVPHKTCSFHLPPCYWCCSSIFGWSSSWTHCTLVCQCDELVAVLRLCKQLWYNAVPHWVQLALAALESALGSKYVFSENIKLGHQIWLWQRNHVLNRKTLFHGWVTSAVWLFDSILCDVWGGFLSNQGGEEEWIETRWELGSRPISWAQSSTD